MPYNTRGLLKRYADEALNDLGRAVGNLNKLIETYGEVHPDYRTAVEAIKTIVENTAEFLTAFREKYI